MKSVRFICMVVAAAWVAWVAPSVAQDLRGIPVRLRPRPAYEPLGMRAGAFMIWPQLTVSELYNDNIYATKHRKQSDWITVMSPDVRIESNWSRHYMMVDVGGQGGMYAAKSDENYLDAHISAQGRLDVQRESFMTARIAFRREHEERGAPDSSFAWEEPAVFYTIDGALSYFHGVGKVSFSGGGEITSIDFKNVDLRNGTSSDLNFRDRFIYEAYGRIAYELLPQVQPFLEFRYNWRCYDQVDPAVGVQRDSRGYRMGIGTGFDLGGITTGDIVFGYMFQDYANLENVGGFWYGLHLLWNVTELTSVQVDVRRTVKETTYPGSSGINGVDATVSVDQELLRNLLAGISLGFTRDSYQGIDLVQRYYTAEARATYLWNRHLSAEFSYRYRSKDSDLSELEYDENQVMLSINASF